MMFSFSNRSAVEHEYIGAGALLVLVLVGATLLLPGWQWCVGAVGYYIWVYRWVHCHLHLHREQGRPHERLGYGFWVTWLRIMALGILIGVLGQRTLFQEIPWLGFSLYVWVMLLDGVDGWAARSCGTVSEFGARFDNHTDAIGVLAASVVAVLLHVLPAYYLLLSAAYFLFHFGLYLRESFGRHVDRSRMMLSRHNRYFAGAHMALLAFSLVPGCIPEVATPVAIAGLVLLGSCFLRDWVLVTTPSDWTKGLAGRAWGRLVFGAIMVPGLIARLLIIGGVLLWGGQIETTLGVMLIWVVTGYLGRTMAWLLLGASALGYVLLPFWLIWSLAVVAWLGCGAYSLCRWDDELYFDRRLSKPNLRVLGSGLILTSVSMAFVIVPGTEVFTEALRVVAGLNSGWAGIIVAVNGLVLLGLSLKGFWLLRCLGAPMGFWSWLKIRQLGFFVSYLTPGPQVGGEPVQVWLMRKKGVSVSQAMAVTGVDKLADLIVNSFMLLIGLLCVFVNDEFGVERFAVSYMQLLVLLAGTLLAVFLAAQVNWHGRLGGYLWFRELGNSFVSLKQLPGAIWVSIGLFGVGTWVLMFMEWWTLWWALGLDMSLGFVLVTFLATRLALWTPVPGGLGVFEAGVVSVAVLAGLGPVGALAVCALARIRDVLLLAFAGFFSVNEAIQVRVARTEIR